MRLTVRAAAGGASALALGYFLAFFDQGLWQPSVDLAWGTGVVAWLAAWWRREQPVLPRLRQPLWLYALYGAALLPFATDWRWAMTADTLMWPIGDIALARHGPPGSLLSVNGADNFSYFQMALHGLPVVLVAPTLFWHRVGKIAVAATAMAAAYTVFARLISRPFGVLVAACAATTSIWIVYTYASYPFLDGITAAYSSIALGLWIQREPGSRRAWLLLGWLSGFMLFLTPNAWFVAFCVWAWLGVKVLAGRWPLWNPLLAGATALLTGLPVLMQWTHGEGGQLFSLVQHPGWTIEKVIDFLEQAAFIPFSSPIEGAGAFGPQLPPLFRWLVIPGVLLTPWFPKRYPGVRLIAYIYAVQVLILAFSQGPYASVSVKRAIMIIPMATYFSFLLFHPVLSSFRVVLPIVALWASFGIHDVVARMQPGRTGWNLLDGVIEAHQRFAGEPVCVVLTNDELGWSFARDSEIDQLYGIWPHVAQTRDPTDPACAHVLCYCPQVDTIDFLPLGYAEEPMLNSVELRCGRAAVSPARDRVAAAQALLPF